MNDKLKQFYNRHSGRDLRLGEDARQRVKENIFSRLGSVNVVDESDNAARNSVAQFSLFRIFTQRYVLIPLVLVLFIAGGAYTTYASTDALPGDVLYPVKLRVESAQIFITPSTERKLELQERFAQKRVEELEKVRGLNNALEQVHKNPAGENEQNNEEQSQATERIEVNLEKQQERQSQIKERARHEASKAIEQLEQTSNKWERRGDSGKAREINDKVQRFKQRIEIQTDVRQNGQVRGLFERWRDRSER